MKKILLILSSVFSMALSSCSGFLDKYPDNSIPADEAIQTPEDAQFYIMGLYSAFKNSALYSGSMTLAADIQCDFMHTVQGANNVYSDVYRWELKPTTGEVENVYAGLYYIISRVNFFFDRIGQVEAAYTDEDDVELLNKCKGDAYFARALAYADLLRFYCKAYDPDTAKDELGMSLIYTYEEEGLNVLRSSLYDTYQQVLSDLAQAEKLITRDVANSIYFTIGAVNALYARTYLYMQDWDNAIKYSTEVIDNSIYSLSDSFAASTASADVSEYQYMWMYDSSNEVIWKVGFTATSLGGSLSSVFHNYDYTAYYPDLVPAQWVLDLYDQSSDARYSTFFVEQTTGYASGLTWPLFIGKYWSNPNLNSTNAYTFVNEPKVFRLSEQYLIRAEAYWHNGEYELASQDLTAVRKKRILGYGEYSATGETLLEEIKTERVKELYMEGFRLMDLKRWGEGFRRTPQMYSISGPDELDIKADNPMFVWPIPQHELDAVPGLQPNESN